jgi:hypothetical protein
MVRVAKKNGATDNITAVLVEVSKSAESSERSEKGKDWTDM